MNVLCVCDKGVNRSVHVASLLKFRGHDTIPVGVDTASPETLDMLRDWADLVIVADRKHLEVYPDAWLWEMPDLTRPYNVVLYRQTLRYIDSHADRLREA